MSAEQTVEVRQFTVGIGYPGEDTSSPRFEGCDSLMIITRGRDPRDVVSLAIASIYDLRRMVLTQTSELEADFWDRLPPVTSVPKVKGVFDPRVEGSIIFFNVPANLEPPQ